VEESDTTATTVSVVDSDATSTTIPVVESDPTSIDDEGMAYNEFPVYPKDIDLRLEFAEAYNNRCD
jgi:hypothetical protein